MTERKMSRRDFMRISAMSAAGAVLARCAPVATPEAPSAEPTAAPAEATAPPVGEVTLDVYTDLSEYHNQYRQILDIFEQDNPGVKINLMETTEGGQEALAAKIAGGYFPAMEVVAITGNAVRINAENYQNFVDLSTIDFPYWDNWKFDVKNAWSQMYGLPGPRCLGAYAGWVTTWLYHEDLMTAAGLNPRDDVKTWDDMKAWLAAGTAWAKSQGLIFWDQGWLPDWTGNTILEYLPCGFTEKSKTVACWKGEAKFNSKDSPYGYALDFIKEAYDKGWIAKDWWTREWETDMESSYAAKKSVVQNHGPWIWDKAAATDPTAKQLGFPNTPPASPDLKWVQWQWDPDIDMGEAFCMRSANEKGANWETTKKLFIWWNSPDVIRLRCEGIGMTPIVDLDPPAVLQSPQYVGVLKDIDTPGGKWENVKYETTLSGELQMAPKRKAGSPGVWDYESGNITSKIADLCNGKLSVQQVLDWAQANWEASYQV